MKESCDENKYRFEKDRDLKTVQILRKKPPIKPFIYDDKEMNKFLGKEDEKRLDFYLLRLPSFYKDVSLEELDVALDRGLNELKNIRRSFTTNVKLDINSVTGLLEPKSTATLTKD